MRNFTKTKVLTLSAMLVLGSASVFGQVDGAPTWDNTKYLGLTAAQNLFCMKLKVMTFCRVSLVRL